MPVYGYAILLIGWLGWLAPFVVRQRNTGPPAKRDRRAVWGVGLQMVAYCLIWQSDFWARSPAAWRVALSVVLLVLAIVLCWSAVRALGRQWRIEAGLNSDHELVQSGPYRWVRHPIYASMLCLLLATGILITPWWLLFIAAAIGLVGTEIRVRIEDALLESRFGDRFRRYRSAVPAYIPFIR